MIRGKAIFTDPDKIKVTLSVTATVEEWRTVATQMSTGGWPQWAFSSVIQSLLIEKLKDTVAEAEKEQ